MRSNRLALAAVLAGAALLGFSSRGVVGIDAPVAATSTTVAAHGDHDGHRGEHHGEPGL
jgi:hypothetical protein